MSTHDIRVESMLFGLWARCLICCFLYSVNLTEYVAMEPRVCVCMCVCMYVCVCVCVCVCVWQRYSPNGWMDFDEIFHKWSDRYLWGPFFSDFEISKRWRHGGHFCTFSLGHSHSRNFAPIFFKIAGEVESCLPLFAFENQRDRLVTSANMADCVFEKIQNVRKNPNFLN